MGISIKEYIRFMGFDSRNENLYLVERKAPTPEEKEITKDLPYLNGVLDFSSLLGARIFKNREIEYKFMLFNTPYEQRKNVEHRIKQLLMPHSQNKLYDTHDANFYWLAKCKSVEVENGEQFNQLTVTIIFDAYPFMMNVTKYFDDEWDNFNFDEDVAIYTKYNVNKSLDFSFFNPGTSSVRPDFIVDSTMKVRIGSDSAQTVTPGKSKDYYLSLKPGQNILHVEGNGTLQIHFHAEVMG